MNIETFNNLFEEFLNKLLLKFDSEKLRFYKNTFLVIKRMKPYVPVYLFISNSISYKKEIINRDENFFIKNDKIKDKCSYFNIDSEFIQLEKLSELDKIAIWDYIQSLFALGEKIKKENKKIFEDYEKLYSTNYFKLN
jgi:hypothetical protein